MSLIYDDIVGSRFGKLSRRKRPDRRKTLKAKLKSYDEAMKLFIVQEKTEHYWNLWIRHRPVVLDIHGLEHAPRKKKHGYDYVGFRVYYKKYFGEVVNVRKHRKHPYVWQMYSDRGMLMMDVFEGCFEWIGEDPDPDLHEQTWDQLFNLF